MEREEQGSEAFSKRFARCVGREEQSLRLSLYFRIIAENPRACRGALHLIHERATGKSAPAERS
jgi:hypothetical protein